jgi:outer membrane protein OmpA-like peptidoglycan-associated protein
MSAFALVLASLSALSLTAFATSATAIAKTPTHVTLGQTLSAKDSLTTTTSATTTKFRSGTVDSWEPSGEAPPGPNALPGYAESYVNDFTGSSLPTGWNIFTGEPGGDAGAQWASSHVVVGGGVLDLNASQDPTYNGEWVTGGLCQCGVSHTYGAYFVRSRLTGAGPTQVELLWPVGHSWPPEIDFNETYGSTDSSMATLHYTSSNDQIHRSVSIDMTQWHTWGVIWTPTSVTYTVDGNVWGVVNDASAIPNAPMTLDIQQQTWCSSNFACPTSNQSTYVDWVAEYTPTPNAPLVTPAAVTPAAVTPAAVGPVSMAPFASNSSALSPLLKAGISKVAETIRSDNVSNVSLVGFTDNSTRGTKALAISTQRAVNVARYLRQRLRAFKVAGVKIKTIGAGSSNPIASNATPSGRAKNRRVVAVIH